MTDKYDSVVAALAELIALTDTPPPLFTDAKEVLEALHDELAAARQSLLLAKDACRLAREHKPIPWSFLEANIESSLEGDRK